MALHIKIGSAPPTTVPTELGQHFIDIVNKVGYVSVGTSSMTDWKAGGGGGSETLLDLSDTPASYVGKAGKSIVVDANELGVSFVDSLAVMALSTGLISGCVLSAAVDPERYNMTSGLGIVVDNTTTPGTPVLTVVIISPVSDGVLDDLNTSTATFISADINGDIVQRTTTATPEQRRTAITIGGVSHSDEVSVDSTFADSDVAFDIQAQLGDLMEAIGFFSTSGNSVSGKAGVLQLAKAAGTGFDKGRNFQVNNKDPHNFVMALQDPITFFASLRNGILVSVSTFYDPTMYDNAGVLTEVPANNNATISYLYVFPNNFIVYLYGQEVFATIGLAVDAAGSETVVLPSDVASDALLLARVINRKGGTDSTNTGDTRLIVASAISAGGGTIATLQQSYDISGNPMWTLNSTNGGLTIIDAGSPLNEALLRVSRNDALLHYFTVEKEAVTVIELIDDGLTASRAVASDGTKKLVSSDTTAAELNFVSGATSNLQAQINAANFLALADTPSSYPTDKIGYGVAINEATNALEFSDAVVLELDGDFDAESGFFKLYKDARMVTLNVSAGDHSSSSQPATLGIVPVGFRPEADLAHLYFMDAATLYMMKVAAATGIMNLEYRDYTGSLVAKTNSVAGASMTWLLNVGVLLQSTWKVTIETVGVTQDVTVGLAGAASFEISWGDGEPDTITSAASETHEYAVAGIYVIRMKGVATQVKFNTADSQLALRSVGPIFGIPGLTSAADMFSGCDNISASIPTGLYDDCPLITTFSQTFLGSTFSGGIPASLFTLQTAALDFTSAFESMPNATAAIPTTLFDTNVDATTFARTFLGYAGAVALPSGIFANNPDVLDFGGVFQGGAFTGSIPSNLFDNNPLVTDLSSIFELCAGLTGGIPTDFFINNVAATTFASCFSSVDGLTGLIPAGMFDTNVAATTFEKTFANTGCNGAIPTDLFVENILVESFAETFSFCSALTTIPAGLFDTNVDVTTFFSTFQATDITAIPATLFTQCVDVVNFAEVFSSCTLIVGAIPSTLFATNVLAENFNQSFNDTPLITNIPVDLFDNNAASDDFTSTFDGGIGVAAELPELWLEYPAAAHEDCFKDCTSATNFADVPFDWGGPDPTTTNVTVTITTAPQDMTFGVTNNTEINVDWGDTNSDTFSGSSITHSFLSNGEFEIKIDGEADGIDFFNADAKAAITGIGLLAGIVGLNTAENMYRDCDLITEFPDSMFDIVATGITNFTATFQDCRGLAGSIPADLFTLNTAATLFKSTLANCSDLTGTIPASLFATNTLVTSFQGLFEGCNSLTGVIPATMFATNTEVTTFQSVFQSCSSLTTIPSGLFDTNTKVISLFNTFRNCPGLVGAVPVGLFDSMTLVTSCISVFNGCTNIETVPTDLFDLTTQVNNFSTTFENCSSITSEVPPLWVLFPLASHFNCFNGVNSAANSDLIPIDWGGALANTTKMEITVTAAPQTMEIGTTNNTSLDIVWGDTNSESSSDALITHEYTVNGTYTLEISGEAEGVKFSTPAAATLITDILGPILSIEGLNTCSLMYFNLDKLTSIPAGLFDNVPLVADFISTFHNDLGLTSIPAGLFDNNSLVTSFSSTFTNTSITNIPANLFDNNTQVTTFQDMFGFGTPIAAIPAGLFDFNTLVTNFSTTFDSNNISEIPAGLFDNNTAVTNFSTTFKDNQITSIPAGLFDENVLATNFSVTFQGNAITSIPTDLFKFNTDVTNFTSTFVNCTNLTTIPSGLFDTNTAVNSLAGLFQGCSSLAAIPANLFDFNTLNLSFVDTFRDTGITAIPAGLFDNNPLVTSFSLTFRDTGITAIPAGLFDNNTAVLSFFRTFLGCTGLAGTIPADLFANNTLVTDFNGTFFDASLITTLQSDMFDNNTLVTDFSFLCNGCTGITSVVPELWVSHASAAHSNTFTGTTSASNYASIPDGWKGL